MSRVVPDGGTQDPERGGECPEPVRSPPPSPSRAAAPPRRSSSPARGSRLSRRRQPRTGPRFARCQRRRCASPVRPDPDGVAARV